MTTSPDLQALRAQTVAFEAAQHLLHLIETSPNPDLVLKAIRFLLHMADHEATPS